MQVTLLLKIREGEFSRILSDRDQISKLDLGPGFYLDGCFHEQGNDQKNCAAKRPPNKYSAHMSYSLRSNAVDNAGEYVCGPCDYNDFKSRYSSSFNLCHGCNI